MITFPTPPIHHEGQVLAHHAIHDTLLDPVLGNLTVCMGSWRHEASEGKPQHLTSLHFHYDVWQPEYFQALQASVSGHPDWSGSGPMKPAQHRWNPVHLRWDAPPLPPLQDHQAAKWLQVKQARESAINAPLATPYGTFDAHAKARASITDAVLLLQALSAQGTPQTIDWTLADNTVVTLTTAQMAEVGVLLGQQVQAAYAQARSLRLQIDTSTTPQEVALVVWV